MQNGNMDSVESNTVKQERKTFRISEFLFALFISIVLKALSMFFCKKDNQ